MALKKTGSVVPGSVETDPSGSVKVCGGIVVNDLAILLADVNKIVSIVPGIVAGDPFGRVEIVRRIVLTDGSDRLPVGVPVTEVEPVKGLVFVRDMALLNPPNGFVFDPDVKRLSKLEYTNEVGIELEIEADSDDELVGEVVSDVP